MDFLNKTRIILAFYDNMTRINAGVDPSELTRQHLLAEHREIKRIPNMVLNGRIGLDNIPDEFSLGRGHVKFFVDKLGYLLTRYSAIRDECYKRGYRVEDYSGAWNGIPEVLMGQWIPTEEAIQLIRDRIADRLGQAVANEI